MLNSCKRIISKIKWVFRKNTVIPGIDEKRNVIEFYRNLYKPSIFVETGTFFGDTVDFFKNKFKSVYSIELSNELAKKATIRFNLDKNIQIIQGDSCEVLKTLVLNFESQALFWLDGHYSSEFYINGKLTITAKGTTNTPIEKELDILLNLFRKHIILIDDARLFTGKDDYPTIKSIKNKVKATGSNYKILVKKDIIHIIPN